jgi:hypothetical protein
MFPGLYAGRNYIRQNERLHMWFSVWQRSVHTDHELSMEGFNVKEVKFNYKDFSNILGVLQYIIKPPAIIYHPLWFIVKSEQTARLHLISSGGVLKVLLKPSRKASERNNGADINLQNIFINSHKFVWDKKLCRYS